MPIKIKLAEYRKTYYETSGKASDVARQLAFAGIAIAWFFKEVGGNLVIPTFLLAPAFCFVVALTLDALQYAMSSLIWGQFVHKHSDTPEDQLEVVPRWWTYTGHFFFHLKLITVVVGYAAVVYYFLKVLVPGG